MKSNEPGVAYSHTARRLIRMRNESYHFLTDVPKKIGDTARIMVAGVGERVVKLCGTKGVVYCNTWLVEVPA